MARRKVPRRKSGPRSPHPTGTLRVIGGRLRGRPITYLGDPRTRPMKQRVREAAFNLLGPEIRGTHVVDLFAGTGALTWEALSRGASSATLIERHFPTAKVLRENAAKLELEERVAIVTTDAFTWAGRSDITAISPVAERPWLVFCSPPYEFYETRTQAMLELISHAFTAAPASSLIVVESDQRFDTNSLSEDWQWDVRTYAPAVLAVAEK